jgi:hypothetical protein
LPSANSLYHKELAIFSKSLVQNQPGFGTGSIFSNNEPFNSLQFPSAPSANVEQTIVCVTVFYSCRVQPLRENNIPKSPLTGSRGSFMVRLLISLEIANSPDLAKFPGIRHCI